MMHQSAFTNGDKLLILDHRGEYVKVQWKDFQGYARAENLIMAPPTQAIVQIAS